MRIRRLIAGLAVTAATVATSFGLAAPASAGYWDEWMYTDDADPGGVVRFKADGDVVEVCDIEADGWKVHLNVFDYTQGFSKYWLGVGGVGNCQEVRASLGGPYNLREGNVFEFTIWMQKAGEPPRFHDTAYWRNVN